MPSCTHFDALCANRPKQVDGALPKVAILLCTYQGQCYLAEQLDSFVTQSHTNWDVWVSDDGSRDNTLSILEDYQHKWGIDRLSLHFGPNKGFQANFLFLTCNVNIDADYYAYSDQDDVWEVDKLARAVKWLESVPQHIPALYCTRTRLVDRNNNHIGFSPLFSKPLSFSNALVQNVGGGNTMVFNNAARALLCKAGANLPVVTHDWWAYLVVTGCGGKVFYDSKPTLRYRQHDDNLVGMNATWMALFERFCMLMQGKFSHWNDGNIAALRKLHENLTPESCEILEHFVKARQMSFVTRLMYLKRSGIYRQTLIGNLGLIAAAIFRKI
ncbi:glycosyltransferase [Desulfovibrio aerotolerans]|uniref:Glycosyltransferase n=1 Tax=Solidesulfovibrio aerotolerans TaxID=295255 RepID=A0A7C9MXA3_9BACT|nr:glycosyltransferase family 2 protein [Solidesulfovibrio aerotolerans]MYL85154.1 glycosyltransferase [Solidesulfovibrio aerotolerans]